MLQELRGTSYNTKQLDPADYWLSKPLLFLVVDNIYWCV